MRRADIVAAREANEPLSVRRLEKKSASAAEANRERGRRSGTRRDRPRRAPTPPPHGPPTAM